MPCYTVSMMSVEFQAKNFGALAKAAALLGLTATDRNGVLTVETPLGTLTVQNGQASGPAAAVGQYVNALRVGYSRELVKMAGAKMGWQVQNVGANKMRVEKR